MNIYDGRLPPVFRMIVSGASEMGKSSLICKLLENENGILHSDFTRVVYLRGVPTGSEARLQEKFGANLIIFDGIPDEQVLLPICRPKDGENIILVIEDLDEQACQSPLISKFYTAYSHHLSCSVVFSTQNFFRSGRERLNLVRNCTHLILFPINLDETVIRLIAQKIYPKNPVALVELFEQITSVPYSHLSIWTNCPKELKFRSDITKTIQKVYTPIQ